MDINDDYYLIVKDILNSDEFIKRKKYRHHGDISVYEHSLKVSRLSYEIAKKINLALKRQVFTKKPFFKQHGFVHAREALDNSRKFFPQYMNKKVENIILRHMFPLNIVPPKYLESWLITLTDKYVSLEVVPYLLKKLVRSFS